MLIISTHHDSTIYANPDLVPSLIEYELAFALPDESPLMELINKGLITMKEKNEILPAWRNWIAGPCTGIGCEMHIVQVLCIKCILKRCRV